MRVELYPHQQAALEKLGSGSILKGGVGTGKSITALAYYFRKECKGNLEYNHMEDPKDLYIITTARKRDSLEWDKECVNFLLSQNTEISLQGVKVVIDSWNNISKYEEVTDAFFIFDEQRIVGNGAWVKSFYKITKRNKNHWILLSATPGDTWMDYIPVFVANGFYKNRTEFIRRHAVYNPNSKYPKIDRFIDTRRLEYFRDKITVEMFFEKKTIPHSCDIFLDFNKELMNTVIKKRWNFYEERPIETSAEYYYLMRKVANSDPSRLEAVKQIVDRHKKVIVFYNFDYELEALRTLKEYDDISVAEWNGHKHQEVPTSDKWVYLVQYSSGSEAWNCITSNTIIFYSLNYSYRIMTQSAGRIDRLNTPFVDLYYYYFRSRSYIDLAISRALKNKRNFNEKRIIDLDTKFASKIA